MDIICEDIHKYRDEIGKNADPETFLKENSESPGAYKKHQKEILAALEQRKRVYLIIAPDFGYSGVYRNPDPQQLSKTLKKSGNDGVEQNKGVCRIMASEETLKKLTQINADKDDMVPPTIVLSIGNILLNREGVGLSEAGK